MCQMLLELLILQQPLYYQSNITCPLAAAAPVAAACMPVPVGVAAAPVPILMGVVAARCIRVVHKLPLQKGFHLRIRIPGSPWVKLNPGFC